MSKLSVYEASAGSGKTFTLTKEYIQLLMISPQKYKHILAVTFTNKATAEMRLRIIQTLYALANGHADQLLSIYQKDLGLPEHVIKEKAQMGLSTILHDYSRFSVETIDKFFLKIIQSFIRELGVQIGFNVELNTKNVLTKAVDSLLEKAEEDQNLKNWLLGLSENRIQEGKNWNIKNDLLGLGSELFKESFKIHQGELHEKFKDKEWLKQKIKLIKKQCNRFEEQLRLLGNEAHGVFEKYQLEVADFKYKQSGPGGYLIAHAEGLVKVPGKRALDAVDNVDAWVTEGSSRYTQVEQAYHNGLNVCLSNLIDLYEKDYGRYTSYKLVLKYLHTLGLTGELSDQILNNLNETNSFLLADASSFIHSIINENDTPFIYEKIGAWYQHFMLDEFQDTSFFQWRNFKPLIHNALSEGHGNMIVGDIKQSIYRWRNSNWEILAKQIDQAFSSEQISKKTLDRNWRSTKNIVQFNNAIFSTIPNLLDGLLEPFEDLTLTKIYEHAQQDTTVSASEFEGMITVSFDDELDEQLRFSKLREQIEKLQDNGISLGEIAILVRSKKEGTKVIKFLSALHHNNYSYRFISDDALFLSKSDAVNLIIYALRYLDNPDNKLARFNLEYYYSKLNTAEDDDVLLPEIFLGQLGKIASMPLYEMIEHLVSIFKLNNRKNSLSYLLSFKDLVLEVEQRSIATLPYFLRWWDEIGNSKVLGGQEEDAIQIMTIHKSKGLEFKAVLLPFCDWNIDHQSQLTNLIWTNSKDELLSDLPVFPLKYVKGLEQGLFKSDYQKEKFNAYLDHLNLFYVALTRSKQYLFISATKSKDERITTIGNALYKAVSENGTLCKFLNDKEFCWGSFNSLSLSVKDNFERDTYVLDQLNSYDFTKQSRLAVTSESATLYDRFGVGAQRDYGKLMHALFQDINHSTEIDSTLLKYNVWIQKHQLDSEQLKTKISGLLKALKACDWYHEITDIRSEAELINDQGKALRPDKIYFKQQEIVVLDFKFGEKEASSYIKQVKEYKNLIQKIFGNKKIRGIIWYVSLDKFVEV